jgi:hypothetical protein
MVFGIWFGSYGGLLIRVSLNDRGGLYLSFMMMNRVIFVVRNYFFDCSYAGLFDCFDIGIDA